MNVCVYLKGLQPLKRHYYNYSLLIIMRNRREKATFYLQQSTEDIGKPGRSIGACRWMHKQNYYGVGTKKYLNWCRDD
ncbi:MAG TPA: hypothetical protein VMS89_09270 [Methanoregulaceae archaeon]|nr:hypothetical protein [Methanoregulaceae archaeon]